MGNASTDHHRALPTGKRDSRQSVSPFNIETKRLVIRPFRPSDRAALYELHSDEDVGRFTGGVRTRQESSASLNRMISNLAARGFGTMAITERKNLGPVIGWCGVKPLENTDDVEIVYGLAKRFWGKGYATESAREMMAWAFNKLKVGRIVALVYPENCASIKVLKRLGMSYDKEVFFKPAASYACRYSVTAEDFES